MDEAQRVKQQEELASQARLTRMMEKERQQQLELRKRLAEQRARETKMLRIVLGVSAILLIIIIIVSLISVLG